MLAANRVDDVDAFDAGSPELDVAGDRFVRVDGVTVRASSNQQ
jgi:hypothetical protein